MNCSISFRIPKALPSLTRLSHLTRKTTCNFSNNHKNTMSKIDIEKPLECLSMVGAILATVYEQPALALTGVNHEEELSSVLIQSGIVAFIYVIVMPPIIMNWIRLRQYRRKLLETYLHFMFVFMFFPSIILWAPFLNFRKFPRDPDMKVPWSEPKDPSKIRYIYTKYPFAKPEDYDW